MKNIKLFCMHGFARCDFARRADDAHARRCRALASILSRRRVSEIIADVMLKQISRPCKPESIATGGRRITSPRLQRRAQRAFATAAFMFEAAHTSRVALAQRV